VRVGTVDSFREGLDVWKEVPPTREGLAKLILRARRRNAWFRKLRWDERRYLEAVVRVVDRLRSHLLLRVVGGMVKRLLDVMRVMGLDVAYLMRTVGKPLAQGLSLIAQGWGNKAAARWAEDLGFIRYLTVMYINCGRLGVR